jgi:hypothetical protein
VTVRGVVAGHAAVVRHPGQLDRVGARGQVTEADLIVRADRPRDRVVHDHGIALRIHVVPHGGGDDLEHVLGGTAQHVVSCRSDITERDVERARVFPLERTVSGEDQLGRDRTRRHFFDDGHAVGIDRPADRSSEHEGVGVRDGDPSEVAVTSTVPTFATQVTSNRPARASPDPAITVRGFAPVGRAVRRNPGQFDDVGPSRHVLERHGPARPDGPGSEILHHHQIAVGSDVETGRGGRDHQVMKHDTGAVVLRIPQRPALPPWKPPRPIRTTIVVPSASTLLSFASSIAGRDAPPARPGSVLLCKIGAPPVVHPQESQGNVHPEPPSEEVTRQESGGLVRLKGRVAPVVAHDESPAPYHRSAGGARRLRYSMTAWRSRSSSRPGTVIDVPGAKAAGSARNSSRRASVQVPLSARKAWEYGNPSWGSDPPPDNAAQIRTHALAGLADAVARHAEPDQARVLRLLQARYGQDPSVIGPHDQPTVGSLDEVADPAADRNGLHVGDPPGVPVDPEKHAVPQGTDQKVPLPGGEVILPDHGEVGRADRRSPRQLGCSKALVLVEIPKKWPGRLTVLGPVRRVRPSVIPPSTSRFSSSPPSGPCSVLQIRPPGSTRRPCGFRWPTVKIRGCPPSSGTTSVFPQSPARSWGRTSFEFQPSHFMVADGHQEGRVTQERDPSAGHDARRRDVPDP